MEKRASGILLPVRSLTSRFGIGDLGKQAYRFADFLTDSHQHYWQILPINYPHMSKCHSPYNCVSAFAGNVYLISPEMMYKQGFLQKKDILKDIRFRKETIDFPKVVSFKEKLFEKAYAKFQKRRKDDFQPFKSKNKDWLDDFALFMVLKKHREGKVWNKWPKDICNRKKDALQKIRKTFQVQIEKEKFLQYVFFKQWFSLKEYCNKKNIKIIGDMPIYVDYHSSDVWSHIEIFKLNKTTKKPIAVSGVPPDYFSATGQLWGNPVYKWDILKRRGYDWWLQRIKHNLHLFDSVRIDHFRGFVAFWEVKAGAKTAIHGKWVKAPVKDFFKVVLKKFPGHMIIAEDLGVITQDVRDIMNYFDFPGMKVLQFAFDDHDIEKNPYLPHNHIENCVIYTGTHDNNTVKGWFRKDASERAKKNLFDYLGRHIAEHNAASEFVQMAMKSVANLCIVPLQDVLGLDERSRINKPATIEKNWSWRLYPGQLTPATSKRLAHITKICDRA